MEQGDAGSVLEHRAAQVDSVTELSLGWPASEHGPTCFLSRLTQLWGPPNQSRYLTLASLPSPTCVYSTYVCASMSVHGAGGQGSMPGIFLCCFPRYCLSLSIFQRNQLASKLQKSTCLQAPHNNTRVTGMHALPGFSMGARIQPQLLWLAEQAHYLLTTAVAPAARLTF